MVVDRDGTAAPTRWTVHGERTIDDTRRLRLSIADVELPDAVRFEQYVLRMPRAAISVPLDESGERVLMIWRHRFVIDRWTWELPGGYVDENEDPAACAAREVEEETGWRPGRVRPLGGFQPLAGTADFENLLFVAEDCVPTGALPDVNEAAAVEWLPLATIPDRISRGEIVGAAAQVALMHLLVERSSPGPRADAQLDRAAQQSVDRRD